MNMTEREKIFYQNLIISDEDNTRIANYLKTKGIEKHKYRKYIAAFYRA